MNDYTTTRAKAIQIIREETVNGTTIGLFKMRKTGNQYTIVTSGGGSQVAKSDRYIYEDFAKWVAAIAAR